MITKPVVNLEGKVGLVTGIANSSSIAYGCAKVLQENGADLILTYQNEKTRKYSEDDVSKLSPSMYSQLDLNNPGELEALMEEIDKKYGKLDFLVHSMAYAPRDALHGRVVDVSLEDFNLAMNISCHSFIRMAHCAEPLLKKAGGGSLITMSYYGAEKVIKNYGIMGIAKAALESTTRYLAYDLGPENITVNAISPGPLLTRAALGIAEFSSLMAEAENRSPLHRLITPEEIGDLCAFLVSSSAKSLTGSVMYADGGYNIVG